MDSTGFTRPWTVSILLSCFRNKRSYMSTFGTLLGQLGNQDTSILSAVEGMLAGSDPGLVSSSNGP